MKTLSLFALALMPLAAAAQGQASAADTPRPKAPVIGLRGGVTYGHSGGVGNALDQKSQVGWEAALTAGHNPIRRAGLSVEAAVTSRRFADEAVNGSRYRWITFQPALLGFVQVVPRVQLLGGVGGSLCISCWRWPNRPMPGGVGFSGNQPSDNDSFPGAWFGTLGVRGQLTNHWFAEGRYAVSFVDSFVRYHHQEDVMGRAAWATFSVGYWLNPRAVALGR